MKQQYKIGDKVTLKPGLQENAYYSGYAGNPICIFSHGMIGIIGAVDVPPVRGTPQNKWGKIGFCCIDFQVDGRQWRTSAYPYELQLIHE